MKTDKKETCKKPNGRNLLNESIAEICANNDMKALILRKGTVLSERIEVIADETEFRYAMVHDRKRLIQYFYPQAGVKSDRMNLLYHVILANDLAFAKRYLKSLKFLVIRDGNSEEIKKLSDIEDELDKI